MRIIVFGANGPTGRLLTEQALTAGHEVVAVTRRTGEFPIEHPHLTTFEGDVHVPAAVDAAIAGGNAVLSTLGVPYSRDKITTYSAGVANIATAMRGHGIRRIAVVSSSAVEPQSFDDAGFLFNRVLQPFIARYLGKTLYDDMRAMEALLTASELDWTIVRPSGLYNLPTVTDYTVTQGRAAGRFTSRADLAASLLRLAEDDRYVHATVNVATTSNNPSMLGLIRTEALGKS
ncbi:NAD(P)-dependent oxidoreductase [Nocardia brevicatena]|uniref:NAD(P)-dependent oxidoreductase n=1 Tax=Nocardia brevicatena TaxID=37327 RepID=UPI000302B89F|nr:NAD(P)H-binding protein [Nocardia brevicatena]